VPVLYIGRTVPKG